MRYECTGNSLSRTHRLKLLDYIPRLRESNLLNMTRITKKQLAQELERIAKTSHGDPELAHGQADVLLLRYINDERVSVAFDSIEKWYA